MQVNLVDLLGLIPLALRILDGLPLAGFFQQLLDGPWFEWKSRNRVGMRKRLLVEQMSSASLVIFIGVKLRIMVQ
jgi:hypothetical protein